MGEWENAITFRGRCGVLYDTFVTELCVFNKGFAIVFLKLEHYYIYRDLTARW